jgi:pimeloyl-ACP methyl ester carboxylesterase
MIFKDELFQAQWLRTAGHASYGGADLGECLAIAGRISEPDPVSWYEAWADAAQRLFDAAEASLGEGRVVSARSGYLRASNYWRAAYTFMMSAPVDPRVPDAYRRQRAAFEAAVALMTPSAERIDVPYEGGLLPGYFFRGSDEVSARPTLIVNGGYDSTAEECFFFSGAAAVARGYHCIVFDGPGQGGALIEDGRVFRPDWEAVIRPVVDYAVSRPEVDPWKIALMGVSFGGYLAPRGASGDDRIAALIADPGEMSLLDEFRARLPPFMARQVPGGNSLALAILGMILRRRLRHVTGGWGLRRCLWVHDAKGPLDYLRMTERYSLEDRADRIRCPTLVCSAEDDEIGVTARALYDGLAGPKAFIAFKTDDGAGAHCESGARLLFNQRAFDWLDRQLDTLPRTDGAGGRSIAGGSPERALIL